MKFNIYQTNLKENTYCCTIEAKNAISALKKYKRTRMTTGIFWIEKDRLYSSFGGVWEAEEVI